MIPLALAAAVAASCPDPDSAPRWRELGTGTDVSAIVGRHLDSPVALAAPMLVVLQAGESAWVGLIARNPRSGSVDPGCELEATAAYYYLGPEDAPELDIRAEGLKEADLLGRLIELRWREGGTKRRWFNVPLARRLGWFQRGDGAVDETFRPIPLPPGINALY